MNKFKSPTSAGDLGRGKRSGDVRKGIRCKASGVRKKKKEGEREGVGDGVKSC
jgi:hypothetical protein